MCCGRNRSLSTENVDRGSVEVVQNLLVRIAETEARIACQSSTGGASSRLEEMKPFLSVMQIIEGYLKQQYRERQQQVAQPLSCRYR